MKIYFEDEKFRSDFICNHIYDDDFATVFKVNAMVGPSCNIAELDYYKEKYPSCIIYTNSILAFSNKYAWNKELKVPEIYIRDENDQWARIDELTNRELRQAHNLAKMYIAGEFYRRAEKLPWED